MGEGRVGRLRILLSSSLGVLHGVATARWRDATGGEVEQGFSLCGYCAGKQSQTRAYGADVARSGADRDLLFPHGIGAKFASSGGDGDRAIARIFADDLAFRERQNERDAYDNEHTIEYPH